MQTEHEQYNYRWEHMTLISWIIYVSIDLKYSNMVTNKILSPVNVAVMYIDLGFHKINVQTTMLCH